MKVGRQETAEAATRSDRGLVVQAVGSCDALSIVAEVVRELRPDDWQKLRLTQANSGAVQIHAVEPDKRYRPRVTIPPGALGWEDKALTAALIDAACSQLIGGRAVYGGPPPRWEPDAEDRLIATVGDVEVWLVEYPVSAGMRVAIRDRSTGDAINVDSRVALVVVEALRTAAVLGGAR